MKTLRYSKQIYRYQRNPIIYTIVNVARDTNALTEVFSFFLSFFGEDLENVRALWDVCVPKNRHGNVTIYA